MRGRYQGGSLASFIIIAVVLALVLVGGLYGLNRYNAQKAADEASKTDSSGGLAADGSDSQTKTDTKTSDTDSQTKTDDSQPKTDTGSSDAAPQPQTPSPSSTSGAALPHTGPADTLVTLLAVTSLTFAGAHYLRSRA